MKKNATLLLAALALVWGLAGCSDDETTPDGGKIVITSITWVTNIPTGTAYAAACAGDKLYLVGPAANNLSFFAYSMADPARPLRLAATNAGDACGIALDGDWAYVSSMGSGIAGTIFSSGPLLGGVNVANPAAPVLGADAESLDDAYMVAVDGGRVFTPDFAGIRMFSITAPGTMALSGYIAAVDCVASLAVSGNCLFALDGQWFKVYDVTTPSAPVCLASNQQATHVANGGVALRDAYAYVTGVNCAVAVYNVTLAGAPSLVTVKTLVNGSTEFLREARTLGSYLLVTGISNFHVLDLADPAAPVLVDSHPLPSGYGKGLAVYNNQYAIVGNDTNFHVLKLY